MSNWDQELELANALTKLATAVADNQCHPSGTPLGDAMRQAIKVLEKWKKGVESDFLLSFKTWLDQEPFVQAAPSPRCGCLQAAKMALLLASHEVPEHAGKLESLAFQVWDQ